MSDETMALRVIEKINSRLKFLYRKNRFLDVPLRRLLCNALIQPHFDYVVLRGTQTWQKKLKDKLQVTQNKCIRFCLKLQCREHISNKLFQKLNWLPINQRFKQCVSSTIFKFAQNKYQAYMNEVFRSNENIRINTRICYLKLSYPFRKTGTSKTACTILDLLFGAEFQKFWRKLKIWILSKIRWNTSIWMISLTQIYELLVDLIMFCLS